MLTLASKLNRHFDIERQQMFGSVLGRCLSSMEGLNAAYLPDGVDKAIAASMVSRANDIRQSENDYAILVTPNGHQDGISSSEALRYRQDDRLAVVAGRHSDLGSFSQSFQEVMGLNYPEDARGEVSIRAIAEVAIDEIITASGVESDSFFDKEMAAEGLLLCLTQAMDAHKELRQGTESWNVYWFAHVDVGLQQLSNQLMIVDPMSLNDFFSEYTFASFGLPRPNSGKNSKFSPSAVVEAFQTYWSDAAAISSTVKILEHHPDSAGRPHALGGLDWTEFDQVLAATDNYFLTFATFESKCSGFVESLRNLTYDQFVSPLQMQKEQTTLLARDGSGRPLGVANIQKTKVPNLALATLDAQSSLVQSEVLRVKVPLLRGVTQGEVEASNVNLMSTTAKTSWQGTLSLDEVGDLWAVGYLSRSLGKAPWKADPLASKLVVDIPVGDSLDGVISPDASADVHLVVPHGSGMWAFAVKQSGGLGRPRYWGNDVLVSEDESSSSLPVAVTLDSASPKVLYIVWSDNPSDFPTYEGVPMERLNGRDGLFAVETLATDLGVIEVGESRFECRSPESTKASHSPIVAAISNMRATIDPLDKETLASLRGEYEMYVTTMLSDDSWLHALGHSIVPQDRDFQILPSKIVADGGVIMSDELKNIWTTISDFDVPEEIINSVEAGEFREAFANLDVPSFVSQRNNDGEMNRSVLSKTSWRRLWGSHREGLERYLQAYAELVRTARKFGDPAGVFWATYPMSISIWETESAGECSAVLLSPLHPIRLAWLSGVESVLWESDFAQSLAGTIEGWNLPLFGPREAEGGRLIAVPVDVGQDQVFMGWSVLVRASTDSPRPLVSPERAGSLAVPGTAVSGLNATAVSAALRSFRQMNPQISTMTIDLAAVTESNRLPEVDEAVLTAIEDWTVKAQHPLIGGARVFDSIKRAGEPPQEKLSRIVRASTETPLTWTRYFADAADLKKCNVRILQDPGVRVAVKATPGQSRLGVLGPVPLRRFEVGIHSKGKKNESLSSPTLREDQGWAPLSDALRECEGGLIPATVTTKLFQANIVSDTADWTVSGEALMNPSAMASIVQDASQGQQMLWEWRPPFLDKAAGIPALERRPFVSVARVPHGFRTQIRALLAKATGKPSSDGDVDQLLGKLGARGVGLSSMLSMGGTHASGALGFFLVFALMENCRADNTYVLPIDACDSFLRALANGADHADLTRRADLLILRIDDEGVTLAPVEIKFYGLGTEQPNGSLPGEDDAALNEPLRQVNSTHSLLARMGDVWSGIQASGRESDRVLWSNGLAALTEAAVKLQPSTSREPEALAKSLANVVNGNTSLRIGQPIVAFFKHDALTSNGQPYRAWSGTAGSGQNEGTFALLSSNAAVAFESVKNRESELVGDWQRIVEWSLTGPSVAADSAYAQQEEEVTAPAVDRDKPMQLSPVEPVNQIKEADAPFLPVERQLEMGSGHSEEGPEPRRAKGRHAIDSQSARTRESKPSNDGIRGEGVRFPVGRLLGATSEAYAEFWPGNTDLNQMNVGIVGDLGTGKTQLMKALVFQLRKAAEESQDTPLSMLVFDYKRDFQEKDFLDAVGGQVLRINNIPLNFFQLREGYSPMAANQRANEFIDVLDKIYGGIGPVQKDRLSMTVTDLYRENKTVPPTLGKILARYGEDQKPDAVTSILRKFVSSEVFSESPESFQSFADLMENNVVVVALNDFGTDDDGKNALVVMFLNLYYDYMLSSTKWPYVGEEPQLRRLNSFLLVDEAVNIMKYKFPVLMNLLLQGREFGFGVMLASQYLSHFKKDQENYGEPLLTWFIHKVKSASTKDLAQLGLADAGGAVSQRILHLAKHEALYSSLGYHGKFIEDLPFFRLIAEQS
jgi:DNA phosphorothioation-dependent restriction protein DptH